MLGRRHICPLSGQLPEAHLPSKAQRVPIRIQAEGVEAIEVLLGGEWALTMAVPFSGQIPAKAGAHVLSIRQKGSTEELARANFVVRQSDL
ncbi:MAG: hypothetical protein FWC18_04345 [Cystobacterineae bacterium]|nr:hypothetical protein [Cystobacterineae bacterium]